MNDIVEAYRKHKNLKLAADELGIKWQTLYCQLKKVGEPITGDKARYGSDRDRLAARAEKLFKDLVPFAVDQNAIEFQAKVDYVVCDQRVDVKASMLAKSCNRYESTRWAFSIKKQQFCADFVVCFAFYPDSDEYKTLLIPGEMIRHCQTVSISSRGRSKWLQFLIDPLDLQEFFLNYEIF